ncbi:MAG: transporter substrate-binding domain-containing protein [Clostridiales Family XIII bacterium]|jgi:polar amino acid transport system substrate-binding protein|nr:transporter substrate-binding domain-containing protein [Clostridiales Family XIII bacterium]
MKKLKKILGLVFAIALVFSLAACGSNKDSGNDNGGSTDIKELTVVPGELTVATGNPAWEPWVIGDDGKSDTALVAGEGLEAEVVYLVAEKLGFTKDEVKWVRADFDASIAPGPKDWDMDIQQFSITDERKKAVDFSSPYFEEPLAVIVDKSGKFANATTVAELKTAVFGAPQGDIAAKYIEENIKPDKKVQIFNNLADVFTAIKTGQIDATVTGLLTAGYNVNIDNAQMPNSKLLGILKGSETQTDPLGILLPKDSPLTSDVTKAVDELREDGTLEDLKEKYLAGSAYEAPVLK